MQIRAQDFRIITAQEDPCILSSDVSFCTAEEAPLPSSPPEPGTPPVLCALLLLGQLTASVTRELGKHRSPKMKEP